MADETPPADPYDVVLADLRAKRDQIDNAINAILALKGQGTQVIQAVGHARATSHAVAITPGMFLGKNIAEAAKQVLTIRKTPLGTQEITDTLQAGGIVFTGDTPGNTVGSVLHRQAKVPGSEIVNVGRGKWALASWFQNPGRFQKKKAGEKDAPDEPNAPDASDAELVAEDNLPPKGGMSDVLKALKIKD